MQGDDDDDEDDFQQAATEVSGIDGKKAMSDPQKLRLLLQKKEFKLANQKIIYRDELQRLKKTVKSQNFKLKRRFAGLTTMLAAEKKDREHQQVLKRQSWEVNKVIRSQKEEVTNQLLALGKQFWDQQAEVQRLRKQNSLLQSSSKQYGEQLERQMNQTSAHIAQIMQSNQSLLLRFNQSQQGFAEAVRRSDTLQREARLLQERLQYQYQQYQDALKDQQELMNVKAHASQLSRQIQGLRQQRQLIIGFYGQRQAIFRTQAATMSQRFSQQINQYKSLLAQQLNRQVELRDRVEFGFKGQRQQLKGQLSRTQQVIKELQSALKQVQEVARTIQNQYQQESKRSQRDLKAKLHQIQILQQQMATLMLSFGVSQKDVAALKSQLSQQKKQRTRLAALKQIQDQVIQKQRQWALHWKQRHKEVEAHLQDVKQARMQESIVYKHQMERAQLAQAQALKVMEEKIKYNARRKAQQAQLATRTVVKQLTQERDQLKQWLAEQKQVAGNLNKELALLNDKISQTQQQNKRNRSEQRAIAQALRTKIAILSTHVAQYIESLASARTKIQLLQQQSTADKNFLLAQKKSMLGQLAKLQSESLQKSRQIASLQSTGKQLQIALKQERQKTLKANLQMSKMSQALAQIDAKYAASLRQLATHQQIQQELISQAQQIKSRTQTIASLRALAVQSQLKLQKVQQLAKQSSQDALQQKQMISVLQDQVSLFRARIQQLTRDNKQKVEQLQSKKNRQIQILLARCDQLLNQVKRGILRQQQLATAVSQLQEQVAGFPAVLQYQLHGVAISFQKQRDFMFKELDRLNKKRLNNLSITKQVQVRVPKTQKRLKINNAVSEKIPFKEPRAGQMKVQKLSAPYQRPKTIPKDMPNALYGESLISMNQKDGMLWIGIQIQRPAYKYYTKNCVWIQVANLYNIIRAFDKLSNKENRKKRMILLGGRVSMIRDVYKGIGYYSLRMVRYYKGQPIPTRNGFNLLSFQMEDLVDKIYKLFE